MRRYPRESTQITSYVHFIFLFLCLAGKMGSEKKKKQIILVVDERINSQDEKTGALLLMSLGLSLA